MGKESICCTGHFQSRSENALRSQGKPESLAHHRLNTGGSRIWHQLSCHVAGVMCRLPRNKPHFLLPRKCIMSRKAM